MCTAWDTGWGCTSTSAPGSARPPTKPTAWCLGRCLPLSQACITPSKGMGVRLENSAWVRPDGQIEVLADFPFDLVLPVQRLTYGWCSMADPGTSPSRIPAEAESPAPAPELPPARILGVESSCDETAAAVVENGRLILSNVVASQVDLHAQFGGIFPEVASRQHIRTIYPIVEQALQQAHLTLKDIDAIAITRGPGLPGSLVVGMNAAKGLALGSKLPLVGDQPPGSAPVLRLAVPARQPLHRPRQSSPWWR